MKISLVTVCYNAAATLGDTIASVKHQDYPNIEYIVVDGGSKDATSDIVAKNSSVISRYISEKDQGIYDAMNKGIRAATGEVVGILNADDFFYNEQSLSIVAESFHDDVDAVYSDLIYVNRHDPCEVSRLSSSANFAKWKIRFGFMVPHPTFYARKSCFERHGYYKLNYRVAADFELMARFMNHGVRTKRISDITVAMREGGISSNGFLWRIHQNMEIARACRENKILTFSPLLSVKIPFKLMSFNVRDIPGPKMPWRETNNT